MEWGDVALLLIFISTAYPWTLNLLRGLKGYVAIICCNYHFLIAVHDQFQLPFLSACDLKIDRRPQLFHYKFILWLLSLVNFYILCNLFSSYPQIKSEHQAIILLVVCYCSTVHAVSVSVFIWIIYFIKFLKLQICYFLHILLILSYKMIRWIYYTSKNM